VDSVQGREKPSLVQCGVGCCGSSTSLSIPSLIVLAMRHVTFSFVGDAPGRDHGELRKRIAKTVARAVEAKAISWQMFLPWQKQFPVI
jgi:hypothetical protein